MKIGATKEENSMEMTQKITNRIPFDPAIPLLGIDPEKTMTRKDTCTPLFRAALFGNGSKNQIKKNGC